MKDQENFVDVTLIRCYHKAYLNKHLDWLQSCQDLTGRYGFQSHNVVVRYFLMDEDYKQMFMGAAMNDYHHAVACYGDTNGKQLNKLRVFVGAATASLHKHFGRWLSHLLLPAALLSEGPIARVVATVMRNEELPVFDYESESVVPDRFSSTQLYFKSAAHGRVIRLHALHRFLRSGVNQEATNAIDSDNEAEEEALFDIADYTPEANEAAALLSNRSCELAEQELFGRIGAPSASSAFAQDTLSVAMPYSVC